MVPGVWKKNGRLLKLVTNQEFLFLSQRAMRMEAISKSNVTKVSGNCQQIGFVYQAPDLTRYMIAGTGYCWCVTETGKPVPGSSVRNSKPLCHLLGVTERFRRGKIRGKGKKGQKGRDKLCTQADRTAFSSSLIEMVSTGHVNMFGARGRPNGTIPGNAKKEVCLHKILTSREIIDL